MQLLVRPTKTIDLERIGEASNLTLEGNGLRVQVHETRDGAIEVRIDPLGRDGSYRLAIHELSAHQIQARLVIGAKGV